MERRPKLPAAAINPMVVDLSHHNDVADFGAVKAAGIAGVIHKATEGVSFTDKLYGGRRAYGGPWGFKSVHHGQGCVNRIYVFMRTQPTFAGDLKLKLEQQSCALARKIRQIKRGTDANLAASNLRLPSRAQKDFRSVANRKSVRDRQHRRE
jgi:Glycosyl hydrolases family 25